MEKILRMPLPEKSMITRFSGVFEAFKKGQSATMVGLPYCATGAFFKSIIDSNHDLYEKLAKGYKFHFVLLDLYTGQKNPENFRKYILERFTQSQQNYLKVENPKLEFTFSQIKDFVKNFKENERLIFVIFGITEYAKEAPELLKTLKELYYLNYQPIAKICFFTPDDPIILNLPQLYEVQPIIQQNVFYMDALTTSEMDYIRKRFEKLDNMFVSDETHEKISSLSGNHYYLYKMIAKAHVLKT